MKTLESVLSVEFGKIRTRSFVRQEDGGNLDNSNTNDANEMEATIESI